MEFHHGDFGFFQGGIEVPAHHIVVVHRVAYGSILDSPVVTDDSDMTELADQFTIEVWGILDLLEIMKENGHATKSQIKALIEFLEYNNDLPYPSFKKKAV
ncbi:hypothetical protein DSCW_29410 [Desulfosarcina widdelii]|uniref:Uncharacterized protein n=2 Tax=Desulfosarcina widdelii TaxID=947919 RepID=A0A5K7ZAN8_9BACT|nr:hypothetical protein DSCW_29410 [Desulfosarcina widdelii]